MAMDRSQGWGRAGASVSLPFPRRSNHALPLPQALDGQAETALAKATLARTGPARYLLSAVLVDASGVVTATGGAPAGQQTVYAAALAGLERGFEHAGVNTVPLPLAALSGDGDWGEVTRNLLITVPGNVVGGGLLVEAAYAWLARPGAPPSGAPQRPAVRVATPPTKAHAATTGNSDR
jgi:hypothetical protein